MEDDYERFKAVYWVYGIFVEAVIAFTMAYEA